MIASVTHEITKYLYIGSDYGADIEFMNRSLDEAGISSYALTTTQVKEFYNQGAVRFGTGSGTP